MASFRRSAMCFGACWTLAHQHNRHVFQVLAFDFGSELDLFDEHTSCEVATEECEKNTDETLSDNIRAAIRIPRAPVALKNYILLAIPSERVKWQGINKVATDYLVARQFRPADLDHVDIGAVCSDKNGR